MASFNKRVIHVFLHPNVLYCISVTIVCFIFFLGEAKSLISTNILRFVRRHHDVSNRIIIVIIITIKIIIIVIIIITSLHFTRDSYFWLILVVHLIHCLDTLYKHHKESP